MLPVPAIKRALREPLTAVQYVLVLGSLSVLIDARERRNRFTAALGSFG